MNRSAFEAEEAALDAELGSVHTKTIKEADAFRDKVDRGIELYVESFIYHWDPEYQKSAENIQRVLVQYGNIRVESYNQESSAITAMVRDLRTICANDIVKITLTDRIDKLEELNNLFITHFGTRSDELAARGTGNMVAARAAIDPIYKRIVTAINGLAALNADAYGAFIDSINQEIGYNKASLAARKTRSKNAATQAAVAN